jgi:surface carbohydrate biosynthesis protein
MKRDVDILIFLEHLNRELDTALLLKILLSSRGYSVKLASVYFDLWESVATLRPDLLIVPWAYSEVKKYCRFFPQPEKGLRILNLHHEQLGVESYMESHMAPSGEAEKVFHLAWGGRFDRILRARGVPPERIFRTGNPRLDFLRSDMRSFTPDREVLCERYGLDPEKKWVFVVGNFSIVSVSDGFIRKKVRQGRADYPDAVGRIRALYARTLDWMERLAEENRKIEVIYRPHPAERLTPQLLERVRRVPGLKLIPDLPIGDWILQAESVFVWSSTSSVDALAADRPVFALRRAEEGSSAFQSGYFPILDDLPTVVDYERFREAATGGDRPSLHPRWAAAVTRYREFYDTPAEPAFVGLERRIARIMETGEGARFGRMPLPGALESFYRLQQAGKRGLHSTGLMRFFKRYEKEAGERLLPALVEEREAFLRDRLGNLPPVEEQGDPR